MWSLDYEKILIKTDDFLYKQQSSIEFKNIIFQIVYFDKIKNEEYKIKRFNQLKMHLKIRKMKLNKIDNNFMHKSKKLKN